MEEVAGPAQYRPVRLRLRRKSRCPLLSEADLAVARADRLASALGTNGSAFRRCRAKQPPPEHPLPHAGPYALVRERRQHTEAFGAVWDRVWLARGKFGALRWLKVSQNEELPAEGLASHSVRELAILQELQREPCAHIVPVLHAFAMSCHTGNGLQSNIYVASWHVTCDLMGYIKCQDTRPTRSSVRCMGRELVIAVNHMHSRGVLHRNLKCQNVLIYPDGHVAVAGFATACRFCPSRIPPPWGHCCTTVNVRPPEMLLGLDEYWPATDVWALGFLVATLALGSSIFQNCDERDMCTAIFRRFGVPGCSHPLTKLSSFQNWSEDFGFLPKGTARGVADARPVAGAEGVAVIEALMDLDPSRRMSARAALRSPFFQTSACGAAHSSTQHGDMEEAGTPAAALAAPLSEACGVVDAAEVASERPWARSVACAMGPRTGASLLGSTVQLCADASAYYHDRDLCLERRRGDELIVAALAVRASFREVGHWPVPCLCQRIWGFLTRPRSPAVDYLAFTQDIAEWMRRVLIDWLVEVHLKYEICTPALFLTVHMLDAYTAQNQALPRRRYQLAGVGALLLACKVEQEAPERRVDLNRLSWVTDYAFSAAEVHGMETAIATMLDFAAPAWGAFHFLCRYADLSPLPMRTFHAAQCCLEGSLMVYCLTRHTPSLLAAAAYFLATQLATSDEGRQPEWPRLLERESGRQADAVQRRARELHQELKPLPQLKMLGVYKKFSRDRWSKAASLVWPEVATLKLNSEAR